MKLTKSFYQMDKEQPWRCKAQLDVKVEYDENEGVVTEVLQVSVYDYSVHKYIDATELFNEHMEDEINARIDRTDWQEVYNEKRLELIERDELWPADNE